MRELSFHWRAFWNSRGRVTVSIFVMNVAHEEGQVNFIPDTEEGGVKHISNFKTLTQHVILAKRMFAPR